MFLDFGAVVTMEPRIDIPGHGGVRIEEMALITEAGCQVPGESLRADRAELPAQDVPWHPLRGSAGSVEIHRAAPHHVTILLSYADTDWIVALPQLVEGKLEVELPRRRRVG